MNTGAIFGIIYDNTAVYLATSLAYPGLQFIFRYSVQ